MTLNFINWIFFLHVVFHNISYYELFLLRLSPKPDAVKQWPPNVRRLLICLCLGIFIC